MMVSYCPGPLVLHISSAVSDEQLLLSAVSRVLCGSVERRQDMTARVVESNGERAHPWNGTHPLLNGCQAQSLHRLLELD
jgi:hypothetical protein